MTKKLAQQVLIPQPHTINSKTMSEKREEITIDQQIQCIKENLEWQYEVLGLQSPKLSAILSTLESTRLLPDSLEKAEKEIEELNTTIRQFNFGHEENLKRTAGILNELSDLRKENERLKLEKENDWIRYRRTS